MTDQSTAVDFMADIEAFHQKFDLVWPGKPRILPDDLFDFRMGFIEEEHSEYRDWQPALSTELRFVSTLQHDPGVITEGLEKQLDAMVDLAYVALGTAYMQFGTEIFREAWRRVHAANMAKVRRVKDVQGELFDSGRAPKYDVVKPAGWVAPDHTDLVENHAHKD